MNKLIFNDAEWEVTRFLNVPISNGILSNKTEQDLNDFDEYNMDDSGGNF